MLSIAETKLKNAAVLTFQLPPLPHYTPQTHTHNTQKRTLPFSLSLTTYPSTLSLYRHTRRHRLLLLVRLRSILIRIITIFFPFLPSFLCLFVCLFLFGFTKFSLSLPFFYYFRQETNPKLPLFFPFFHFPFSIFFSFCFGIIFFLGRKIDCLLVFQCVCECVFLSLHSRMGLMGLMAIWPHKVDPPRHP